VVLHPVNARGEAAAWGYELKTDSEGKTSFDGVPYGKLRVQVLARDSRRLVRITTSEGPTLDITVRLKRPQGQYSDLRGIIRERKEGLRRRIREEGSGRRRKRSRAVVSPGCGPVGVKPSSSVVGKNL